MDINDISIDSCRVEVNKTLTLGYIAVKLNKSLVIHHSQNEHHPKQLIVVLTLLWLKEKIF